MSHCDPVNLSHSGFGDKCHFYIFLTARNPSLARPSAQAAPGDIPLISVCHGLQAHGSSGPSVVWPSCPLRTPQSAVGQPAVPGLAGSRKKGLEQPWGAAQGRAWSWNLTLHM